MASIRHRAGVENDIFEIAAYILQENESVAMRFVDAVEATLKDLARMPGMGSRKDFNNPRLSETRTWWVKGFPNHLIYYFPTAEGISVLAIAHGARDIERLLRQRSG